MLFLAQDEIATVLSSIPGIAIATGVAVIALKKFTAGNVLGHLPTWLYVVGTATVLTAIAVVMKWLPFEPETWRDWVNLFVRAGYAALLASGAREMLTSLKVTPNTSASKTTGIIILAFLILPGCTGVRFVNADQYATEKAYVAALVEDEMSLATNTMRIVRVMYIAKAISDEDLPAIKIQARLWVDSLNKAADAVDANDLVSARRLLSAADRALMHLQALPGVDIAYVQALRELQLEPSSRVYIDMQSLAVYTAPLDVTPVIMSQEA